MEYEILHLKDPQYFVAIGRCAAACCAIFGGRDDCGIWKTCYWCGRKVMMVEGEDDQPKFIWRPKEVQDA